MRTPFWVLGGRTDLQRKTHRATPLSGFWGVGQACSVKYTVRPPLWVLGGRTDLQRKTHRATPFLCFRGSDIHFIDYID